MPQLLNHKIFGPSHKSAGLGNLPIKLSTTKIKAWVFLLKSFEKQLLLQLFLLDRVQIGVSFEDGSPSDPFLSFLQLDHHFAPSSLALLYIPTALLRIDYSLEVVAEVRWGVFESHCEGVGCDGYTEDASGFDVGGQRWECDVADEGVERLLPLIDGSILEEVCFSL